MFSKQGGEREGGGGGRLEITMAWVMGGTGSEGLELWSSKTREKKGSGGICVCVCVGGDDQGLSRVNRVKVSGPWFPRR